MRSRLARVLRRIADWLEPPDEEPVAVNMFTYERIPQGDGTTLVIPRIKSLTAEEVDD